MGSVTGSMMDSTIDTSDQEEHEEEVMRIKLTQGADGRHRVTIRHGGSETYYATSEEIEVVDLRPTRRAPDVAESDDLSSGVRAHLRHLADGGLRDGCAYCLRVCTEGGTGVPVIDEYLRACAGPRPDVVPDAGSFHDTYVVCVVEAVDVRPARVTGRRYVRLTLRVVLGPRRDQVLYAYLRTNPAGLRVGDRVGGALTRRPEAGRDGLRVSDLKLLVRPDGHAGSGRSRERVGADAVAIFPGEE